MMSYVTLVLVLARCTRLKIRSPGNLNRITVSYFLEEGEATRYELATDWRWCECFEKREGALDFWKKKQRYRTNPKKRDERRKRQRVKE
jgi:hypothetical protein